MPQALTEGCRTGVDIGSYKKMQIQAGIFCPKSLFTFAGE